MLRPFYLATLLILQLALIVKLAPPLAQALRVDALAGLAPGGWSAIAAAHRHGARRRRRGAGARLPWRCARAPPAFRRASLSRLPPWAVVLALAGISLLCAAALGLALAPIMPAGPRAIAYLVARPAITGGLALAIAGVLCAELLRSGIAVVRERSGGAARVHPYEGSPA